MVGYYEGKGNQVVNHRVRVGYPGGKRKQIVNQGTSVGYPEGKETKSSTKAPVWVNLNENETKSTRKH